MDFGDKLKIQYTIILIQMKVHERILFFILWTLMYQRMVWGVRVVKSIHAQNPPSFQGVREKKIATIFLSRNRCSEFAPFVISEKVYI